MRRSRFGIGIKTMTREDVVKRCEQAWFRRMQAYRKAVYDYPAEYKQSIDEEVSSWCRVLCEIDAGVDPIIAVLRR